MLHAPVLEEAPSQPGGAEMDDNRERAHDMAEEGLDKVVEGDEKAGKKLIEEARKIDPKSVDQLAEEVERDKKKAERFIDKK
jgi:hypothetical protein